MRRVRYTNYNSNRRLTRARCYFRYFAKIVKRTAKSNRKTLTHSSCVVVVSFRSDRQFVSEIVVEYYSNRACAGAMTCATFPPPVFRSVYGVPKIAHRPFTRARIDIDRNSIKTIDTFNILPPSPSPTRDSFQGEYARVYRVHGARTLCIVDGGVSSRTCQI